MDVIEEYARARAVFEVGDVPTDRPVTGHGWFYRGCRECCACGRVHAPPDGMTEEQIEWYRYAPSMP